MFEDELVWLYHASMILKSQGVRGDLLEIGSFEGLSACSLAQTGKLTCVDTWDTVCGTVDSRDSFQVFMANLSGMGLMSNVTAIVGDSKVKLPELAATGVRYRLIFVDGDHSYAGARADISNAWKMLSPGGLLVVDDYAGWPDVQRACTDSLGPGMFGACGKIAFKSKGFEK